MKQYLKQHGLMYVLMAVFGTLFLAQFFGKDVSATTELKTWVGPSLYTDRTLQGAEREKIRYGFELISNTAEYFGPQGSVARITNGMNCQNCHLDAGRKLFGNSYALVASSYPKYRARSGNMESIYKRVSDCMERSLNGKTIDSLSMEYQAIEAYIKWVGTGVTKKDSMAGASISKLPFLNRAANSQAGKGVYLRTCSSCHGVDGGGLMQEGKYVYPPLWGAHSYNQGAGLYRLSNFAGFVYDNMPLKQASHGQQVLSLAEAWDVAAFVNSQPRPAMNISNDWPDLSKKPFDHPFGPYTDGFSENQHKYGPFYPIILASK